MKSKISAIAAPVLSLCMLLSGCGIIGGKEVQIEKGDIMSDIDLAPAQAAAYESYSAQAYNEYKSVADLYTSEGEVDRENSEVNSAACKAAAKLYAYACYNERRLDKYVYFSNQQGNTDLGSMGSATAARQEYYLRVNESDKTCGYRYHSTLKKVVASSGTVSGMKGLFESARIRITDKTNLLYRFEGDSSTIAFSENDHPTLDVKILDCSWKTNSKDWGKPDIQMKKAEFIAPENIKEDIENSAGEDNVTIRGNINILAENIVKTASVIEDDEGGLLVVMNIDTSVANADAASLKMIRNANGSDDCKWTENDEQFTIVFRLWSNGLFRSYSIAESWQGKISGFSGEVSSSTTYNYSYSDRDCDMGKYLEMLENAKNS